MIRITALCMTFPGTGITVTLQIFTVLNSVQKYVLLMRPQHRLMHSDIANLEKLAGTFQT